MSDEKDNEQNGGVELDLDELNWDDALAEWEQELDVAAEAESDPMPQHSEPPPKGPAAPAPPRPLYRPPSKPPPPRPRKGQEPELNVEIELGSELEVESFEQEQDVTRIGQIPDELLASLGRTDEPSAHDKPTRPPPAGPLADVDLDLDGLLDNLTTDEPTSAVTRKPPPPEHSLSDPFGGLIPVDDEGEPAPEQEQETKPAADAAPEPAPMPEPERATAPKPEAEPAPPAEVAKSAPEPAVEPATAKPATEAGDGAPAAPKPFVPPPPPPIPGKKATGAPAKRAAYRPPPPPPPPGRLGGGGVAPPPPPKPGGLARKSLGGLGPRGAAAKAKGAEPPVAPPKPIAPPRPAAPPPAETKDAPAPPSPPQPKNPPAAPAPVEAKDAPASAPVEAKDAPPPVPVEAKDAPPPAPPPAEPADDTIVFDDGTAIDDVLAELGPPSEPPTEAAARPPAAPAATDAAPPPPAPTPAAPTPADERPDVGAQAARRTVKYRKPRPEHFPLVGRDHDALAARRELLRALAGRASGSAKARLLVAAAEIAEQLGEADAARALYAEARGADPKDPIVLRALRRDAMLRGDHGEVAALLEAEAALPLSPADRSGALALLAEVQLHHLGDAAAAERSARSALGLRRDSIAAALLLAEACAAQKREAEGAAALERAAEAWSDPPARAALLLEVARTYERQGNGQRALERYRAAAEADGTTLEAWIGAARCARATGDVDGAVEALLHASTLLGDGGAAEAFRRLAARLVHVVARKPGDALALLESPRNVLSWKARAEAAAAVGDAEARAAAVEAWAQATGGTERALALLLLADLRADAGDLDGADAALRDAALADGNLGMVQVVREVLARRAGDSTRLARAVETTSEGPGASLVAAARIARDRDVLERERELLAHAVQEGDAPVTADVLSLDLAAAARDEQHILAGLRRQVERATPENKVGPLLVLSDLAAGRDDLDAARELLREARDVSPGDPVVLRPLGRIVAASDPREAAAMWLEEASAATGERAAYAAMQAGRLLAAAGGDPSGAFRRALDADGAYAPAAWALEPLLRDAQDVAALADLHERLADLVDGRIERAGRCIRAALLRGAEDPAAAAALLDKARTSCPDDTILYELMLRLGDGMSAAERAALLVQSADNAPGDLARSARLRAAAAFEIAGEAAQAAVLYRQVLQDAEGGDPIALRALDRAELAAGEHARVADRRFQAVKDAPDEATRVVALERMADFDLERGDESSAMLSLQSILEVAPGHVPSLRALERHYMDERRDEDLVGIEEKLTEHLTPGPDVTAHARLAARLLLAPAEAGGEAADGIVLTAADRAEMDLWLARRVVGAATAARDGIMLSRAQRRIVELLSSPHERVAEALRAADALDSTGDVAEAAAVLAETYDAAPSHPTAGEELARLRQATGDARGAAEAYESAARAARVARRAASLWYRAGVLWQDTVGDPDRAVEAFGQAAELAPTYLDVFDRLKRLLTARGEMRRVADLAERRIAEGGEPQVLVGLHLALAEMREELGQATAAKESLRAALALEPERLEALRRLADLCLTTEDWRGAAEALIKIARLRKDRDELRWVFFTLGEIYDTHMPDPRRAEAAYRRVLKLVPDDTDAMERLAELYRREGNTTAAAEMLQQLAQHEVDPDRNRDYQLRLAASLESQGDLRQAESVLEQSRRKAPTDLTVLRAMADFYQRQNAQSALAMHLGRAIADYRQALGRDPSDAFLWPGLAQVLDWRGLGDAARCVASAAYSLGVTDVELSRYVDPQGGIPGGGGAAADPGLDEMLSPPTLSRATRAVFQLAGEALEKALPFDLRAFSADRLSREHGFRNAALEVGRWFGVPDMQIYQTYHAPRVCVAVSGSPVTILIGGELFTLTDEREKIFLLARAVKVARAGLSVAVRSQPSHLALAVAGLVRSYDPRYAPPGLDSDQIDAMAHTVAKHVHRRVRDELYPLVMEMGGAPGFDPSRLGLAASELGDRMALLATGSVPAAMDALLKLAASPGVAERNPSGRAQAVRQVPEAASLLEFAVSDILFEARRRVGADRL